MHYQTAYQWVRAGSLPAVVVRGRYRIDRADLDRFARQRDEPRQERRPAAPRWGRLAERLGQHLLRGEEHEARTQVVELADRGVPVSDIITNLFVPALRSIGEGWVAGTVTIAEEHRATAIVERLIGQLAPNPRGRRRGRAVVAALSGDHHALPTTMAAATLREDRWHVEHLGSDVPPAEVVRFAGDAGADLVVLSVTNPLVEEVAVETSQRLRSSGVPTIVGAPGRTLEELRLEARASSPAARRPGGSSGP